MEILEMPIPEEVEGPPPVNIEELEQDLAAFELWREASSLDIADSE